MSTNSTNGSQVAELGYKYIELLPGEDFFPFYTYPHVDKAKIEEFKQALKEHNVEIASLIVMEHWAGPKEEDREAANRKWKRCIEVAVELGVNDINRKFTGHKDKPSICKQKIMGSMKELLFGIEKSGVNVNIQAHPFDFIEQSNEGVDIIRGIDKDLLDIIMQFHTLFGQS